METTPFAQAPLAVSRPASLRDIYLQRLQRLQRLRRLHAQELNRQGLRLLDRAVFAAYCDCRNVGAEEEALEILRDATCTLEQPAGQLDMADAGPEPRPEAASQDPA